MDPLAAVFVDVDRGLVNRFIEYHRHHPDVYDEFKTRAVAMREAGRNRYSQWTIVQSIRWDYDLKYGRGGSFKINNDFIAMYARLMIHEYAEFATFFELRTMKASGRAVLREERRTA